MTNPYGTPQPPKKLYRSPSNKVIGGVCGGVADYLNMDATLVRVLLAAITIISGGFPIVLYILGLFLIPEEPPGGPAGRISPPHQEQWYYPQQGSGQAQPPTERPADPVWGPEGAPWDQGRSAPRPPDAAPPPEQRNPGS